MSKYDAYWQSKTAAILDSFNEARSNGTSAPLELPGLDELGQRKTWYGRLDIRKGQPTYAPAAPMQSLGRVLSQHLPQWALELDWRLIVSEDRKLTVRCIEEAEAVGEKVDTKDRVDKKQKVAHTEPYTVETSTVSAADGSSDAKAHSGSAFSQRAFDLLEGLHKTPTGAYYQQYKAELKTEVQEPFQALFRAVNGRLPAAVRDAMESERRVFSRFLKNDWGQGGAWDYYWGALYSKEGKRSQGAQLGMWIAYDRLKVAFNIGDYGGAQRERFQHNCERNVTALTSVLQDLLRDEHLFLGSQEELVIGPDGTLSGKINYTWEQFLKDPAKAHIDVSVILPRSAILQTSREEMAVDIARTFTLMFPLVLLATLDDPMPAIEAYVRSLSPAAPTTLYRIVMPTVTVADRSATAQPQPAFSQRAFDLLEGLHRTPTKEHYQQYKDEFKAEVEEPFQALFRAVTGQLPAVVREAMESERHVFSRFLKNDWGQGGVWDYYWGALYPKGGKRTQDAQLWIWVNHERLEWGFAIGNYGSAQVQLFRRNCQANASALLPLLSALADDEDVMLVNDEDVVANADGTVSCKTSYTWEQYLTNPRQSDTNVRTVWLASKVVQTTREQLAAVIARTLSRLFTLVLLATQDNPLPAIERYVESLGLSVEPFPNEPPPKQPEYPLSRCAEDTCMDEQVLERWVNAIERKGQAIIYGPPGTGKTYIAQKLTEHLIGGGDGFSDLVQFHPAYAYEDFIQGIRPRSSADGGLEYPLVSGRFLDFCERAKGCKDRCVLIIDEINRANLARVFGELMFLMEYRDANVPLASGGLLRIPPNVRIIGTMNTADRSIALVDHALRRRFAFLALYPNYDVLKKYHERHSTGFPVDKLIQKLTVLNRTINDRHYEVGISYFLRGDLEAQIEDIWHMEIEPYLEEYFYDQPSKANDFRWERIGGEILA